MARKRMIDPEFWSDEEIGNWSHSARLFYIGLWNFADDEGRFKAHSKLLKSQIFPYDNKVSISKLKNEIENKVKWYGSNGLQYGYLKNFLKHQRIDRPTDSKLPNPNEFDEDSSSTRRHVPPNIREVKLSKEKLSIEHFLTLWGKYPKRLGKGSAEKHFIASVKTEQDWDNINKALNNYISYIKDNKTEYRYIKYGSAWFNQWKDWIDVVSENKENDDWYKKAKKELTKGNTIT